MKQVSILCMCILLFTFCGAKKESQAGWDVTVRGKVAFPEPGQVTIQQMKSEGEGKTDTIVLAANNTYEKKLHLTEPGYYTLNFFNKQTLNIILYKSDVEVNADGNNQQGAFEVKGSPDYDLVSKVQAILMAAQNSPEIASLKSEYSEASQANNTKKMSDLQDQYLKVMKKSNDEVAAILRAQPASLGLVEVLGRGNVLNRDEYFDVYVQAAEKLKKEMPNAEPVRFFIDDVERSKVVAIGMTAPEISMPNPKGDTIKLSSLRGKYVLVDFWAKWCGPCRRENPNVVKAYQRFKNKDFEILGVSLDRSKEDWVQAIREDGLTWTQVSDLKYFDSKAAHDYNISAIPFSILLDPRGVIIAKNLRGAALDKKLSELFPEK